MTVKWSVFSQESGIWCEQWLNMLKYVDSVSDSHGDIDDRQIINQELAKFNASYAWNQTLLIDFADKESLGLFLLTWS
jgi:hypothetical protein